MEVRAGVCEGAHSKRATQAAHQTEHEEFLFWIETAGYERGGVRSGGRGREKSDIVSARKERSGESRSENKREKESGVLRQRCEMRPNRSESQTPTGLFGVLPHRNVSLFLF